MESMYSCVQAFEEELVENPSKSVAYKSIQAVDSFEKEMEEAKNEGGKEGKRLKRQASSQP
eukprot:11481670-Heterocapsa_arctica.AAC.1